MIDHRTTQKNETDFYHTIKILNQVTSHLFIQLTSTRLRAASTSKQKVVFSTSYFTLINIRGNCGEYKLHHTY